jgi:hypothetical protein
MAELAESVEVPILAGQLFHVTELIFGFAVQKSFGFANREAQFFVCHNNLFV